MRCKDIMKGPVSTISRDASIQEAARLMEEEDIGFLPVVDGSGKAVGTLTDRDITIRLVAKGLPPEGVRVHQVMTPNVVSCKPDDDVEVAARLMQDNKVSRVLVVDAGKPIGVISLGDLAERRDESEVGRTIKEVKEGVTLTH
jgi:CBS domain-containing protein